MIPPKKLNYLTKYFSLAFLLFSVCPKTALADSVSWQYQNPLTVGSFSAWFSNLLSAIQGIVGWLAVIMIFIGGIIYILSAGVSKQIELAKNIIKWALVGFAVAVGAPALLKELRDFVFGGGTAPADFIDSANSFQAIAINVLNFLLSIVGILALLGFAVGGVMYLLAMGDKKKTETGRNLVTYSVIAIAVASGGIILLRQILILLGG